MSTIQPLLPAIIRVYFDESDELQYDRSVLLSAGMEASAVDAVISDVERNRSLVRDLPRLKNSLAFLRQAKVLSHPTVQLKLAEEGLLP